MYGIKILPSITGYTWTIEAGTMCFALSKSTRNKKASRDILGPENKYPSHAIHNKN